MNCLWLDSLAKFCKRNFARLVDDKFPKVNYGASCIGPKTMSRSCFSGFAITFAFPFALVFAGAAFTLALAFVCFTVLSTAFCDTTLSVIREGDGFLPAG